MDRKRSLGQRQVIVLLACAALAACDVETFDDVVDELDQPPAPPAEDSADSGTPDPNPDPSSSALNPVFSEIQASIFTPTCASASCHGGANPAAELNLEADSSYSNLVGVASTQDAAIERVVAGDPDSSYLIQKLEGTAATGGVMPPSGGLPQATIDVVRQWITDGAIDDRVASTGPVKLRALSPTAGSVLSFPPTRVIAGFDRELNAASVDGYTVVIESTGGDGNFDNGAVPVPASNVRLAPGNSAAILVDLSESDLADDTYRIRLSGGPDLAIEDLDGQRFDGDADGMSGGDYVAEFTLKRD